MIEKEFIELLDKSTYFAAFSMLDPESEKAYRECVNSIKQVLSENGDTFSEETQEWAVKLLLREAIDDYVGLVINDLFIERFSGGGEFGES